MPARKDSESKQGLIVTLVIAILLVVILGATTWSGYSGRDQLEKNAKEAAANKTSMEKSRDWHKYQMLQTKAWSGLLAQGAEAQAYAAARQQFVPDGKSLSGGEDSAEMQKAFATN